MDGLPWKHILGDKLEAGSPPPELPPVIEASIIFLEAKGLDTQGLFRVPGSASRVKALKEAFSKSKRRLPDLGDADVHTVCSLLTDHLRNEEPLLTYSLAPRWIQVAGMNDLVLRLTNYVELINQLPLTNHASLFALLRLLVQISQHSEKTLMPASNLGTIFGPMICRRLKSEITQELADIPSVSKLCIDLINNFNQLFDYELDQPSGGGGAGGGGAGGGTGSASKKNTRRKFQFGKENPSNPSSLSSGTMQAIFGEAGVAAFGDESALVGADTTEADAANGERRKNASSDDADVPGDHPEQAEGADTRPSNTGSGRSILRSFSTMGGHYTKKSAADESKQHVDADTVDESPQGDEDVGEKKKLSKKRKNSNDKKKLRMFSPLKLFDKDRYRSSENSDSNEPHYDQRTSDSSERESISGRLFGGRIVPFLRDMKSNQPKYEAHRKSSSWPEVEFGEIGRKDLEEEEDSAETEATAENSSKSPRVKVKEARKTSYSERGIPPSVWSSRVTKDSALAGLSPRARLSEGKSGRVPEKMGGNLILSPRSLAELAIEERGRETVPARFEPGELGLVKWKKRNAQSSARQKDSKAEDTTNGAGGSETKKQQPSGVAFLLSRYYSAGGGKGLGLKEDPTPKRKESAGEKESRTTQTKALGEGKEEKKEEIPHTVCAGPTLKPSDRAPTSEKEEEKEREKEKSEWVIESEGYTETEGTETDEAEEETTEEEGSGGQNSPGEGEEKARSRRKKSSREDKLRRRKPKKDRLKSKDSGLKTSRKPKDGDSTSTAPTSEKEGEGEGDQQSPTID